MPSTFTFSDFATLRALHDLLKRGMCAAVIFGALLFVPSLHAQSCIWTSAGQVGDAALNTCGTTLSSIDSDYSTVNPSDIVQVDDSQSDGFGVQGTSFYVAFHACDPASSPCTGANSDASGTLFTSITDLCGYPSLVASLGAQAACGSTGPVFPPQGRLTLSSNTPVMTSDVTAATSVYYTPYLGSQISIYDACCSSFNSYAFSQLTMTLSSSQGSGGIYDLFVFLNSGTVTIGAGPAWASSTSRGTGSGTTQLTQLSGLWVNANAITLTNGSNSFTSIPADAATYVGSVYATSAGETAVQFKPTPAAGGTNNVVGLWNAYNRVPISSLCSDSTTLFTDSSNSPEPLDNNNHNRVTYLDGLGQSDVLGSVSTIAYSGTAATALIAGAVQDSTTSFGDVRAAYIQIGTGNTAEGANTFTTQENFPPNMGLHYLQAMQESPNSATITFAFNGGNTFLLFDGEY
jgi:hypothetical protein